MSIEGGGTATSLKRLTGTESQGVKARAKPGGQAEAPAAGGFLALLTALGSQAGVDDEGAATVQSDDGSRQVATQAPTLGDTLPLSDPAMMAVQSPSIDLAMLLAQAGESGGDKLGAVGDGPRLGSPGAARLAIDAAVADPRGGPPAASAALGPEDAGNVNRSVNALLDQTAQSLPVRLSSVSGSGTGSPSGAGASLREAHLPQHSPLAAMAAREPAMLGAVMSSGLGEGLLRPAERPTARLSVAQGNAGMEGLWGQPGPQPGHGVEGPAAAVDPSMLSFESTLAETVSYWATQGVQNAELTLGGPGGEAVEVRISVKGEDAHIDFRTDQPEIRRVLEGAAAHLRDILATEGLVLSGVSVGSSGQEGAAAQEQRHRQGARRATLVTPGVAPAEAAPGAVPSIARAVDIFV